MLLGRVSPTFFRLISRGAAVLTARESGEWPHDGALISKLGDMNILASRSIPFISKVSIRAGESFYKPASPS